MKKKNSDSIPVRAVLIGVLGAFAVSVVILSVWAGLLSSGRVGEDKTTVLRYVCTALSAAVGGILAATISKRKAIAPILVGVVYWLLLICCGMLLFKGDLQGVGSTALIITVCTGAVCATCMKKPSRKGYKKLRAR